MQPNIVPATVDLGRKIVSGSRVIAAPAEKIFDLLADPGQHHLIDGSGTVHESTFGPDRMELGAKFGMKMSIGPVPYRMPNTVSEFEQNRVVEWHHFGRHRWRYELEPVGSGTRVTETFAWGPSILPHQFYPLAGYPERHRTNIDKTLERLAAHFA